MSSDFLNLLDRLVKAGVDFVIVGGFAGVVHGCTYVTQSSKPIEVKSMQIRVLSLDALIKTKKAMNRPRDKVAILQLEAIKKLKGSNATDFSL